MQYRVRLGKDIETLFLDDHFLAVGSWNNVVGNWSQAGSNFVHATNNWDFIYLSNIFTPSFDQYKIEITFANTDAAALFRFYIGNYSIQEYEMSPDSAVHTFDLGSRCLAGDRLVFTAYGAVQIDRIRIYTKDWNTPLVYEPDISTSASLSLSSSTRLDIRDYKSTYSENMIFYRDGYDYLLAKYNVQNAKSPKEFCVVTPVLIERLDNGDWVRYFEGVNLMSDNTFDYLKHTVSGSVEDIVAGTLIQTNSDKAYEIKCDDVTGNNFERGAYDAVNNTFEKPFNYIDTTGAIQTQVYFFGGATCDEPRVLFHYFRTLRQIVHEECKLQASISSTTLTTGTFKYFSFCKAKNLTGNNALPPTYLHSITQSFKAMIEDSNIIFDWGLESNFLTLPVLKIESYSTLLGNSQTFSLDNNQSSFKFNTIDLYKTVNNGYTREFEINDGISGTFGGTNTNQWFPTQYNALDECSTEDNTLNSEWLAAASTIDDFIRFAGTNVDFKQEDYVYIEVNYNAVSTNMEAGILGFCGTYNTNITTYQNMLRHIYGFQSDFIGTQYTYEGVTVVKPNNPLVRDWDFENFITFDQLEDILNNQYYRIPFDSEFMPNSEDGYIIDFKFNNITRKVTLKLLTQ